MLVFHQSRVSAATTGIVVVVLVLWSLAACSPTINVVTRFNTAVDYKEFESFSLAERELSLQPSWVDGQIKMDVERVMKSKGYTSGDASGADLLVFFQTQRNESYPLQFGGRRRKKTPSLTFDEGSLTLEIRDSFNQQIYRGVARDIVAPTKQKTRQRLSAAVVTRLDDFPEKE